MPGRCTLSAHGAGKLIVKTDGQTKTEKDMYAKLCPAEGADKQNYIHGSIIMSKKGMGCPISSSPCHVPSMFGLMFFIC
jgi:hypothetical protein